MLAEVAQAASAMQGLQRNAMAMREAEQERTAMTGVADMINKAKGQGLTPDMMRQMAGALGGMPRFVNESVKLLQAADVMERERRDASLIEAIENGTAAPAGASVPAAPAGGVAPAASVAPSAAPAVAQNALAPSAPAANAMLPELRQSDMIQGGAAGTATTSAVGRGVGAPMLTQFMPPMPPRTEYDEATARIDAMRRSISLQITRAQDPGLTEQERLQAREIATLQSTELQKAQQTIGNYLANMGEADLPGGLIEPAQVPVRLQMPPELTPASAPQPEPAPIVTPRAAPAAVPAGVQVAGPMVAGAEPDENEAALRKQIAALEAKRSAYVKLPVTSSAGREKRTAAVKDLDAQIKDLRTELRDYTKPSDLIKSFREAKSQGFKGTIEDWKRAGGQQISVSVGAEKKYSEVFSSAVAKADQDKLSAAENAPNMAANASRILDLLDTGKIIAGPFADIRLLVARGLNVAGANNDEVISNTERLISSTAQQTLDAIRGSGLGLNQGFTDKDREFLQQIAGGKIDFQPKTLRDLAELQFKAAQQSVNVWNSRATKIPRSALEGTGISSEPLPIPERRRQSADRPVGVGPDWTLKQDAKGNRAWVSPDGKRFVEVK
jgi:hypothetical protein